MGVVYNPLKKPVQVRVFGNYFEFAPGKMKVVNDDISRFISTNKKETGLVEMPEICIDEPDSELAKKVKTEKSIEGVRNALKYYNGIVNNLKISMQKDLDKKNDKSSVYAEATEGEIYAAKMVEELSKDLDAVAANKEKEAEEIFKKAEKAQNK